MNTQTNTLHWVTLLDLPVLRIDAAHDQGFGKHYRVWIRGKFIGQVVGQGNLAALLGLPNNE